jgi:hypothetical protein
LEIEVDNDRSIRGQDEIKVEATRYFKQLYAFDGSCIPMEQANLARQYQHFVTEDDNLILDKPVTKQDIWEILSHFAKDKSLGPDGWTVEFFTHFFDLVGDDLHSLVEDSRSKDKIKRALNSTFLVLIPKENSPQNFGDFRPIALCNLCYKIISKVVANRIRPILSRSLSTEQLVFLKGRKILDVVGMAHECIHSIHSKKQKALILKLDLKKAYDCVSWNFLPLILAQSGFTVTSSSWIMSCVTSTSFVVLINGETSDFFKNERRLRQGCPLLPLLFILVMESLSILLKKRQEMGELIGVKVSRVVKILHLIFVDDVLIMTKASIEEWQLIKIILDQFCSASGLQINIRKSTFHHSGLEVVDLASLKDLFSFNFSDLTTGFKYLGYFIKAQKSTFKDWRWLLKKFDKRIKH